jgi:ribosomal protein S18 acetylase RimI-like enzyme
MTAAMQFDFRIESIRTPALTLDYYSVPWDSAIFGVPVAQIADIHALQPVEAVRDYGAFADWSVRERIELCACRLPADRTRDILFLQERDFRCIELNYEPYLDRLQEREWPGDVVSVVPAVAGDRELLADMAGEIFRHGRFHQDPRIDPALGDLRYRVWMSNAFSHPSQRVLKCLLDDAIVGFFVVEYPRPAHCHWSLIGLAPGLQGRGLGKRVWAAMLRHLRDAGIQTVSTSISSHNVPVFNLYVSLGFRFPSPAVTLQWRPPGAAVLRQKG